MPYKNYEDQKKRAREYYHKNSDKVKIANKIKYAANREQIKKLCTKIRHSRPQKALWWSAKARSKRSGIEFSITPDDIIIPEICPVLGIRLEGGNKKNRDTLPSIDRLNSKGGYTKDNIRIISYRANTIKSNATAEELLLIYQYVKREEK